MAIISKARVKVTCACNRVIQQRFSIKCHKRIKSVKRQRVKLHPQLKIMTYSSLLWATFAIDWKQKEQTFQSNTTLKHSNSSFGVDHDELEQVCISPVRHPVNFKRSDREPIPGETQPSPENLLLASPVASKYSTEIPLKNKFFSSENVQNECNVLRRKRVFLDLY